MQIVVEKARSSGFDPFFERIKKGAVITVPDEPFAGGGFGDIYHVLSFDGVSSPMKQVVKIFKDDRNKHGWQTISELQEALIQEKNEEERMGGPFLARHPSFIGFPQLIFQGSLGNKKVRGHVTANLISIGCLPLDKILPLGYEGKNDRKKYLSSKALDRAVMAYQLADCFSILHRIHYIHADITPDNIMVDPSGPLCALIDYDSGVVVKDPKDNPITYGKLGGDWTAPELQFEILKNGLGKISINHHMDLWSIAAAIHNLIYGFPHLFLANLTRPSYQEYVRKYPDWPDIDVNDPLINPKSKESYLFYRKRVIDGIGLRKQTLDAFRLTFTKGIFDSSFRTSVEDWVRLLQKEIGADYLAKIRIPEWATSPQEPDSEQEKKEPGEPDEPIENDPENKQPPKQDSLKLFNNLMRDLAPDILKGKLKFQTHRPMIEKYANNAGLDGKAVAKDFDELLIMYQGLLTKRKKVEYFSNSEKLLLQYQARLAHVDVSFILGA